MTTRLERGRFDWPQADPDGVVLAPPQVSMLLKGIDWRKPVRTHAPDLAARRGRVLDEVASMIA